MSYIFGVLLPSLLSVSHANAGATAPSAERNVRCFFMPVTLRQEDTGRIFNKGGTLMAGRKTHVTYASALHKRPTPRASELAARQIADLILRRRVAEGERLPNEGTMATQLGVSRSTLREALRLLESWGLVRVERGRGKGPVARYPGVADVTRSMAMLLDTRGSVLTDVTEARIAIESACVWLAAKRYHEPSLHALLESVDSVRPGTTEWQEHTVSFHTALAASTGNQVLETVVASLGGLIRYSASLAAVSAESQKETLHAHRRIAQALLAGDPARAERRLVGHMRGFLALTQARFALDVGSLTAGLLERRDEASTGIKSFGRATQP